MTSRAHQQFRDFAPNSELMTRLRKLFKMGKRHEALEAVMEWDSQMQLDDAREFLRLLDSSLRETAVELKEY